MIKNLKLQKLLALFLMFCIVFASGCTQKNKVTYNLEGIPDFCGEPFVELNNNVPDLNLDDYKGKSFEKYSNLDSLGRCGTAYACIGTDIMPTEQRGNIGQIKPSGWQTAKYDFVDGKYLYNRCHLIGFQLSGENANEKNLITGTRYLNVEGMLPFENMVADYVKQTSNHVLYRVTPVFEGDNLLASGVVMEALSVEDGGKGISFKVYCYNAQPRVIIDYANGENYEEFAELAVTAKSAPQDYVLNINSKKFHLPTCGGANNIKAKNKETRNASKDTLIEEGYSPCKICNP